MGLLENAIAQAEATKAQAQLDSQAVARAAAATAVLAFTDTFGLDAVWIRSDTDITYVRRSSQFGGERWVQDRVFRHRIRVDDVILGLQPSNGSRSKPQVGVIYLPCSECGNVHPVDLGYVSTHGDPEAITAGLVAKIGHAATAERVCSACKAQPCPTCGAARR